MATCIHSSRSCLLPFYTIPIFPLLNRKIFHLLVGLVLGECITPPLSNRVIVCLCMFEWLECMHTSSNSSFYVGFGLLNDPTENNKSLSSSTVPAIITVAKDRKGRREVYPHDADSPDLSCLVWNPF